MGILRPLKTVCVVSFVFCILLTLSILLILGGCSGGHSVRRDPSKTESVIHSNDTPVMGNGVQETVPSSDKAQTGEPQQGRGEYRLIALGNGLAIYTKDNSLIKLLPFDISSLPQTERELLSLGMECNSWQEVISLIEDLTG